MALKKRTKKWLKLGAIVGVAAIALKEKGKLTGMASSSGPQDTRTQTGLNTFQSWAQSVGFYGLNEPTGPTGGGPTGVSNATGGAGKR